jgi:type II secretory pathway pseudopilin PulG
VSRGGAPEAIETSALDTRGERPTNSQHFLFLFSPPGTSTETPTETPTETLCGEHIHVRDSHFGPPGGPIVRNARANGSVGTSADRETVVSRRTQAGYAMAVLLVGMSVMAIMMTAVLPVWKQMSRREKETELVFRGEQYARAIQLFQAKAGPGTLPASIDLLVDQRFLRKKFKDPITNDDFAPLLSVPGAGPGAAAPGGAAATPAGRQGGTAAQPVSLGQRGTPGLPQGVSPGAAANGGIMGVTSKSKDQSIRLYKGRNHYNEWQFMPVPRAAAPGTNTGARGGQRGNPNGPQPFGTNPGAGRQSFPPRGVGPGSPNPQPVPFPPSGGTGR